jgi:hypothetical protein
MTCWQPLAAAVQANCHVADARHAADMTLCTYLLQMREFCRWERGLAWRSSLLREDVGAWIEAREALWAEFEERPLEPLPCGPGGAAVDPFDVVAVNEHLLGSGLLYGAGLVGADRPVFFLAEQHGRTQRDGIDVRVAGRELARGLLAPPAVLSTGDGGECIVLRRESLARWCWEKFEAFGLRPRQGSAFHAVVQAYGLDRDFDAALPQWLDDQSELVTLHELGEHRVGLRLGSAWAPMRLSLPGRRADLFARAVRDHLADFDSTLPTLLDRGAAASLHAWFSDYTGVRQSMFPSLTDAYVAWRRGDGGRALRRAIAQGGQHFTSLAHRVLALHGSGGPDSGKAIEDLLTSPAARCVV